MSDWIDDMVKRVKSQREQDSEQDKLRLHKAQILAAVGGTFLTELTQRVKTDCDKLLTSFPNDPAFHCVFEQRGDLGFVLMNDSRQKPRRRLEVEYKLEGHCIEYKQLEQQGIFSQFQRTGINQLHLSVNNADQVQVENGQFPFDIENLSRRFCSMVCQLP
jgi:hypothetical protein